MTTAAGDEGGALVVDGAKSSINKTAARRTSQVLLAHRARWAREVFVRGEEGGNGTASGAAPLLNQAEPHVVLRAPDGILSAPFGLQSYCAGKLAATRRRRREKDEEDAVYTRGVGAN